MADLIDDEDFFDAGNTDGLPVIAEELREHIPVIEIAMDENRKQTIVKENQARKKKNAEDYKKKKMEREDYDAMQKNIDDAVQTAYDDETNGMATFTVNQAAYNMERPGYTVILYGPRRSGKSKFIRNLCQRMRHLSPEVVVFTMTKSSGEYFQYLPYARVIEGLDEDVLDDLIEYQMRKKEARSRGEDAGNTNLLIVIDDCMAEGLRYKKTFNRVFYNGRHNDITLTVAVQDVRGIAPSATINCDLAACFSLPDKRGRDTIQEKFAAYLTKDEFDNIFDHPMVNKKYQMVFFDVAHRYNPIDKRISIGTVDEEAEESFIMGDKPMWESEEAVEQLQELGFGYMLNLDDWGIVKPRHASADKKAPRFTKTKNAATKK